MIERSPVEGVCADKWLVKDRELRLDVPIVMGILNVTPDSFSDGGVFFNPDAAIKQALTLVQQGAKIIDVGGESTRPGAMQIDVKTELQRTIPIVESLVKKSEILISIDTQKSEVARAALDAGAHIVNDVSGGFHDKYMLELIEQTGAGYILMHMQGIPENMQDSPHYDNVIDEISDFFIRRIELAKDIGIDPHQIAIDPGIGFGKTLENNLSILANINEFLYIGLPILIGASRKSFIGAIDQSDTHERLGGSITSILQAHRGGAQIFRVHDVRESRQALELFTAIQKYSD